MELALVGGTGKEGRGLAMRWARAGHRVTLGSRDGARAAEVARELSELSGMTIHGTDNATAVGAAELVVLCVPYAAHATTLEGLREVLQGKVLVDITVPLKPPRVRVVQLPEGQSAALEAQALLGEGVQVAAALHHVSSLHLAELDHEIDCDVLVCADDPEVRAKVVSLIAELRVRALDAGKLANAVALESLTPVLIHMNKRYKSPGTGLRITGIPEPE